MEDWATAAKVETDKQLFNLYVVMEALYGLDLNIELDSAQVHYEGWEKTLVLLLEVCDWLGFIELQTNIMLHFACEEGDDIEYIDDLTQEMINAWKKWAEENPYYVKQIIATQNLYMKDIVTVIRSSKPS